jgi:hypothetical protein
MSTIVCEMWFCTNCALVHANGECGEIHAESCAETVSLTRGDFVTAKCDCGACEPLSEIPPGHSVTAGILQSEHDDSCPNRNRSNSSEWVECDCGNLTYSTRKCDGCGTTLHGSREAHTLWRN